MALWRRKGTETDYSDEGRAAAIRGGASLSDFEAWADEDTSPGPGPLAPVEAAPVWVWAPTGALFSDAAYRTAIAFGRLRAADFTPEAPPPPAVEVASPPVEAPPAAVEVASPPVEAPPAAVVVDIDRFTKAELQDLAAAIGLSLDGTKAELLARISAAPGGLVAAAIDEMGLSP